MEKKINESHILVLVAVVFLLMGANFGVALLVNKERGTKTVSTGVCTKCNQLTYNNKYKNPFQHGNTQQKSNR